MSPTDVRQVTAYGKRIAQCVMRMSSVVTDVVYALPPSMVESVLARLSAINKEMGDASLAWESAAVPTEELDDA